MRPLARLTAVVASLSLAMGACGDDGRTLREPGTGGATARPVPPSTTLADLFADAAADQFTLRSPAVGPGGTLPFRHARGGANIPPELQWRGVPADAVELAVVMVDLSANDFVHWVVSGIDPTTIQLFEALVPPGAVQAINDFGEQGWGGPAPPLGEGAHTYVFKLFALGAPSGIAPGTAGAEAIAQIEAVAIGVTELITFFSQENALDP